MQKIDNNHITQIKRFLTYQKTAVLMLGIIAIILMLFLLKQAQTVFVPFTIAWVLSRLLTPIMLFLKKRKIPTGLSVVILLLGMAIFFFLVGTIVTISTASFTDEIPQYVKSFSATVQEMSATIARKFPQMGTSEIQEELNKQLVNLSTTALGLAKSILSTLTGVVSMAIMILIMLAFMLISAANSKAKIDAAFSSELSAKINTIIDSISSRLSKYLYIQTIISLITGILVGLACKVFGISSPLTWGFLTFILNYIPTVGSIIASIPPIIIAIITYYPNWWPIIGITLVILGIQQILGNVISPKLMGESLDISPVMILFGLLLFTWMWGIVGAWLSVMIVATIRIVCGNIEPLKPIGVLLSQGKATTKPEE